MSLESFQSTNFVVQFESTEFTPAELAIVQPRAQAILNGFENDYGILCNWFGIVVGAGLGANNQVLVTLTKNIRGASNGGYSSYHPRMTVNVNIGGTDDSVLSLFVAEMIEILMSYKGNWNAGDSGGEGLSRVAAELLHPNSVAPGGGNVNAWLAFDPTQDLTSAVADSEYRKNWVFENFKGSNLKAGGYVPGDQDSYSFGCSILFIYYLKDQLGFSMPQIVQNGGATLAETYKNLTGKNDDPFWAFKSLLSDHFPQGVQSPSDNPFPLTPSVSSKVAPGMGSSNNTSSLVFIKPDNRVFYTWWVLGEGGKGFGEMDGNGRSDSAPAAALVGGKNNYLFSIVKGLDNSLYLNQGELGKTFVGWQAMNFQTNMSPGAASSGDTTAVVAVSPDGRIFYTWWVLGEGGKAFTELDGGGHTDAAPAIALVGKDHNYLFSVVKGLDGNLYLNQGGLGELQVGWQIINFQTRVAPCATSSGNISVIVAVSTDGRIFYSWWELGKAGSAFIELSGGGHTDVPPAASLVGNDSNYLFVVVKGLDGNLYLNQGELGKPFVGWQQLG